MEQYIKKSDIVAEIKSRISDIEVSQKAGLIKKRDADKKILLFKSVLSLIDTLEVKEVDLTNMKTDWCPSNKQIDSLRDLLKYNIGVFNYQKFMEVNSLYEDLTKILDYETNRQK